MRIGYFYRAIAKSIVFSTTLLFCWLLEGADTDPASPLHRAKYVLLDGRVIDDAAGVKLVVGKATKSAANPLFVQDKPWEVRFDNLYANVIYDEKEKQYKCWYSPFVIDSAVETTPREERADTTYWAVSDQLKKEGRWQREMGICYATSEDGLHWTKPEMEIRKWKGKPCNIVDIGPHGAGIFLDSREKDPARRYKLFTGLTYGFSADGIHWTEPAECPEVNAIADTHNNAFWCPQSQCYVGITRNWSGGGYQGERIVARTESKDFIHWSQAEEILRGTSPTKQTYAMVVFPYADVYLGLVMIFDTQSDRVFCELASSPDAIHWERIDEGVPLIANSETTGDYDWGTVYAAAYPVFLENEIRLYYGAGNGPHTNWRDGSLALATLRPDGFAGMQPENDDQPSTIVTQPVMCTGKSLGITADAKGGSVRVEVLDADGFSLDQCHAIVDDVTREPAAWHNADLSTFVGKPIRLKFELRKSTLFAFEFLP